jgi:hypothetical protein
MGVEVGGKGGREAERVGRRIPASLHSTHLQLDVTARQTDGGVAHGLKAVRA